MSDVIAKFGVEAPDVDEIIKQANEIPKPKIYRPLHEYGEAIHIMYNEKNMSWKDIATWFKERGLEYTPSHFSQAHKMWCAQNGKPVFEKE